VRVDSHHPAVALLILALLAGAALRVPPSVSPPVRIAVPRRTPVGLVNINTAEAPALEALPGVGPATSRAIVAARPFAAVDELRRVRGIGPARLRRLRPFVTVR